MIIITITQYVSVLKFEVRQVARRPRWRFVDYLASRSAEKKFREAPAEARLRWDLNVDLDRVELE